MRVAVAVAVTQAVDEVKRRIEPRCPHSGPDPMCVSAAVAGRSVGVCHVGAARDPSTSRRPIQWLIQWLNWAG